MKFFEKVYLATKKIPKGKVVTYGQLALAVGNPKAARAVGWALHNNPTPIVVPCHRIVNRQGKLAECFGLGGKEVQKELLEKEGVEVNNFTVDLERYGLEDLSEIYIK